MLTLNGLGAARLSELSVRREGCADQLIAPPLTQSSLERDLNVVSACTETLQRTLRALDLLDQKFSG